jgi:hypothetical protein
MYLDMKLFTVALAATAFFVFRNRSIRLDFVGPGKKIRAIAKQASRGKLNDALVTKMLKVLSSETIGHYDVDSKIIEKAGIELARYGTPDACLLAMHLSNYSDVKYSESTIELIRNSACMFSVNGGDTRTIDIVRGKYLFDNLIGE